MSRFAEVNSEGRRSTPKLRRLSLASLITALLLGVSLPSGASGLSEAEYQDAVHSFQIGRTSEAFGKFMDLANRGDPDAARIASFMYQYGPALFDKHWDPAPYELAYWNSLARNSGPSARATPEFVPAWMKQAKAKAAKQRNRPEIKTVATTR